MDEIIVWRYLKDSYEAKKLFEVDKWFIEDQFISTNNLKIIIQRVFLLKDSLIKIDEYREINRLNDNTGIHKLLHQKFTAKLIVHFDFFFTKDINSKKFVSSLRTNSTTFLPAKILKVIDNNIEEYNKCNIKYNDICKEGMSFLLSFVNLNEGVSTEGIEINVSFWATDIEIEQIEREIEISSFKLHEFKIVDEIVA